MPCTLAQEDVGLHVSYLLILFLVFLQGHPLKGVAKQQKMPQKRCTGQPRPKFIKPNIGYAVITTAPLKYGAVYIRYFSAQGISGTNGKPRARKEDKR